MFFLRFFRWGCEVHLLGHDDDQSPDFKSQLEKLRYQAQQKIRWMWMHTVAQSLTTMQSICIYVLGSKLPLLPYNRGWPSPQQ